MDIYLCGEVPYTGLKIDNKQAGKPQKLDLLLEKIFSEGRYPLRPFKC